MSTTRVFYEVSPLFAINRPSAVEWNKVREATYGAYVRSTTIGASAATSDQRTLRWRGASCQPVSVTKLNCKTLQFTFNFQLKLRPKAAINFF